MTIRLTLPVGLTFIDWADQVVQDLEPEGLSPINAGEDKWQTWATSVCQIPLVSSRNPPDPNKYDSWEVWATHFVRSVY